MTVKYDYHKIIILPNNLIINIITRAAQYWEKTDIAIFWLSAICIAI